MACRDHILLMQAKGKRIGPSWQDGQCPSTM